MTAANVVYLLEPSWNPALEDQAIARVSRLGQNREVTVHRYITDNTIEEVRLYRL
jgi:SNF2 family DNA or RNA helicase